jgi:alpha-glucosidase (family GH31 glycosyl hydrolase)
MKIVFGFSFLLVAFSMSWQQGFTQKKQNDTKTFWKETFNSGAQPEGWDFPEVGKWDPAWIVTDQPFPGSYKYQQQAPPIASKSRKSFLMFEAGYFTDEDVDSWAKKKQYPDGYVISKAINCSGKNSVILRFQQKFRWWDYKQKQDSAGLFVGISTDKKHWKEYDVRNNVPSATDMFTPLNEELNITDIAANQPTVYIRFYWRGLMGWYWMVDDVELAEAYQNDLSVTQLTSHTEEDNKFSKNDVLKLKIRNSGTAAIVTDFDVLADVDGKVLKVTEEAKNHPLQPNEERLISFPALDLTNSPVHKLHFFVNLPGDENKDNDNLYTKINSSALSIGNMTGYKVANNVCEITSGVSKFKVIWYAADIFRIWFSPDGNFSAPDDIVINLPKENLPSIKATDKGDYILLSTKTNAIRAYKKAIRFALYDASNTKAVWEESKPMEFGPRTTQFITRGKNEYLYGCGMQNGYFSHRDTELMIEKGGGWDNGGRPNPVPFYMSSNGYGVLRNTFDAGVYSFKQNMRFTHNENRFDAFYFTGGSLKNILEEYTRITGRPFLMPRWALGMGDANCYNRGAKGGTGFKGTTPDVITKVADEYVKHDMPRGWILPNDGYGCGYVQLDSTINELSKRGFHTGLWTENGVEKIAREVGQYGSRLCKLDVAWVGPGYKYALDGCKAAYNGIENNSDGRGFVWSVMGWAGTHRYSVVWTGDQSSSWEYIRFHIPTVIGSGLSAQNCATGDVDAIFGGSDSTYVRDLQWKCFTPVLMTMSGWAKKDKQPYIYGEPYTSINRKYLRLKLRLTPYMYTYCNEAYEKGTPTVRAMVLEFPKDSVTWGKQTQYQYMLGESFLVAPVYKKECKRDSIYLPKGKWYDYWDGTEHSGNQWINNYDAPLDKLPLFVKAGAIIPMYPEMNYDGERRADTLTLDIFPSGKSSFDLYEDDGTTREHRKGAFAKTLITVAAGNETTVTVNAAKGNYNGKYLTRNYVLQIHNTTKVSSVMENTKPLKKCASTDEFNTAASGFYLNGNVLKIKSNKLSTSAAQKFLIK